MRPEPTLLESCCGLFRIAGMLHPEVEQAVEDREDRAQPMHLGPEQVEKRMYRPHIGVFGRHGYLEYVHPLIAIGIVAEIR